MCATSANLVDNGLPEVALRRWALTSPFPWRRRLAQDGALLGSLTRIIVESVQAFYAKHAGTGGKTGAVTVIQRTSSDLRLNPHVHVVFLDGAYCEQEDKKLAWVGLGHLQTREVGEVLEHALRRMEKHLRRRGLLEPDDPGAPTDSETDGAVQAAREGRLAASAVSGQFPPQARNGCVVFRR